MKYATGATDESVSKLMLAASATWRTLPASAITARPGTFLVLLAVGCVLVCSGLDSASAQQTNQQATQSAGPATQPSPDQQFRRVVDRGVAFLLERGQDRSDGSFSKQLGPAVTALCVSALLDHDVPATHPQVAKSLTYIQTMVQPDGGIYAPGSTLRNYETSVALMCFQRINQDGTYDELIQNALRFLKGLQWDEGEQHPRQSAFYGGQGYGKHKRPDASNTSFFMDALQAAGEDADSEAIQKALVFMSRCQNLSTEHNSAEYASVVTDEDRGGFIYSPVGKGESKAGETPEGGLRSYASMSYAGLKSLLYAGVDKEDIRVKAAMDWISRHYDLGSNPGLGQQGLYYYFHVFAKALAASGLPKIETIDGQQHDWRSDLTARLAELQAEDGSWTNEADRWYEGDPNLVTSFALLSLAYCKPTANADANDHGSHKSGKKHHAVGAIDALKLLRKGNDRFVAGKPRHPHEDRSWREELESGQHPFAVVLSCSDSRVPTELVFDQGFGDVFTIRVAGNVVDNDVTASVEYAIDHLETELIMVLGHTNCGAVTATVDHLVDPEGEPAEVVELLYRIEPATMGMPEGLNRQEQIDWCVEQNVRRAVRRLSRVPDLRRRVKAGKAMIVGAVYDMHTGKIGLLN